MFRATHKMSFIFLLFSWTTPFLRLSVHCLDVWSCYFSDIASICFRQNVNKTIIALLMKTDHFACLGKWFLWQFRVNFMKKKVKTIRKTSPKKLVFYSFPLSTTERVYLRRNINLFLKKSVRLTVFPLYRCPFYKEIALQEFGQENFPFLECYRSYGDFV